MPYAFGTTSLKRLEGVHPKLVAVATSAIARSSVDFMVLEGVRTPARQLQLYAQGRTKPGPIVTWTKVSNHFKKADGYGHAVDLVPWPVDWNDLKKFDAIAQAMFAASRELSIPIRWGADWDRDGKPRERGEGDSPHFELAL